MLLGATLVAFLFSSVNHKLEMSNMHLVHFQALLAMPLLAMALLAMALLTMVLLTMAPLVQHALGPLPGAREDGQREDAFPQHAAGKQL